ncbi:putative protein C26F1.08c [Ceratocystis platani]|uniref:Integral membrane bound transporter domain-containing protein n=1 Tax=Ceratocystis fimbriata f. sp. platani TaxID=88771 RepID=A0A0F8B3H7_CERFI|nr:putative protein C26F1.08c [Ceratocystis platani]
MPSLSSATSPSVSSGGRWPSSRRGALRDGTFIDPRTGERLRRHFSLNDNGAISSSSDSSPERFHSFETAETLREHVDTAFHNAKQSLMFARDWACSSEGRSVLCCSLAYVLGSLATYWAPLSSTLGKRDGKHVVATITVYFHPARTIGSMVEAIIIAILAIAYAALIGTLAMCVSVVLAGQMDLVWLSHFINVTVFIGGALGFVGWVKQKMNQPLVNVASTLASITIISIVTKEDAIQGGDFDFVKVEQTLKILVMGICFSAGVSLLVWRRSARKELREAMCTTSIFLGDMIAAVTRGFISGSEEELRAEGYGDLISRYNSHNSKMIKAARESKFEHYILGQEKEYQLEKNVIKSMERLAQSIGGLRSASNTQYSLLSEPVSNFPSPVLVRRGFMSPVMSFSPASVPHNLGPIEENLELGSKSRRASEELDRDPLSQQPGFRTPSEIFEMFISMLGPSMKSLAFTLSEILKEPPFRDTPTLHDANLQESFKNSLRDALALYNNARGQALRELYLSIQMAGKRSEKIQADIEEVAASCGHFSFSLQAVADEIGAYLDTVDDIKFHNQQGSRSWSWLMFWRYLPSFKSQRIQLDDDETAAFLNQDFNSSTAREVNPIRRSAMPRGIPESMQRNRDLYSWDAAPDASQYMRKISAWVLAVLRKLGREDIRFGLKIGIGASLWGMLAFLPSTRPTYNHWRGEWGLLSYMIVVAMTVGASNATSFSRFLGTVIGASLACLGWVISQGNGFVLIVFGWLVSVYNFYLLLVVKNGPLGRITLLAWNVIVLYAYSLSQDDDDNGDDDVDDGMNPLIFEIAYHRALSVSLGILWGMIVCRLIWPASGRRKFKEGMAVLYLQLGLIWKRGPLGHLLHEDKPVSYIKSGEQDALQRYVFKLETLRTAAINEFELRGPFPSKPYSRMLLATDRIIDAFYAMSQITQKRNLLSPGEKAILEDTIKERAIMCDRICHVFHVIASSIMLEYPIADATPDIEGLKDRLLSKIHGFRKTQIAKGAHGAGVGFVAEEKDYALIYAYILITSQVAAELKAVRREVDELFGVLSQDALLLT